MKKVKKASVLIYSIVLTSIALILAVVVMNNHLSLILNAENVEIEKKFYMSIKSNIDIFSKTARDTNSDGGDFVDNISCPGQVTGSSPVTMSGTTKRENVKSALFQDGDRIICISDYNGKNLEIYFNEDYDGFGGAKYDTQTITLTGGPTFTGTFAEDNTKITIPENSYDKEDGFDDNFNNDNFQSKITN